MSAVRRAVSATGSSSGVSMIGSRMRMCCLPLRRSPKMRDDSAARPYRQLRRSDRRQRGAAEERHLHAFGADVLVDEKRGMLPLRRARIISRPAAVEPRSMVVMPASARRSRMKRFIIGSSRPR